MATINLGRIKPVFRGAYAGATAYVVDDIVTSGGECFICILASTGNATSNATYWTKLAEKGADGTDGIVAWQAVITADPSNAVAGRGYFCNTTAGAFSVTLPTSATIGDKISFIDYAATFDTNNLTIGRNSHKIQGASSDFVVATERAGFSLVFVDATQGWLLTEK